MTISIVIQTKNIRTGFRKEITDITFPIYADLKDCEVIVSDFGSIDGTEEFVKSLGLKYVYTEPNEREFLNMSKCLNNAIVNHAKYDLITPSGVDFIYPNNFAKVVKSMYNGFNRDKEGYQYMIVKPREFDFQTNNYHLIERYNSYNYIFTKEMYYKVGGFDERIADWGGEDEDLKERFISVFGKENIKYRIPNDIFLLHIKHPLDYEISCRKEIHPRNMKTLKENMDTKGQNIVNSYYEWEPI